MINTPGFIVPESYASEEELETELRRQSEVSGFTSFDPEKILSIKHSYVNKPPLDDNILIHYGIKGMKWGVRRDGTEGVSRRTDREASRDAQEFARAKLFYGEGAGTRRKLIKAKVEQKSKQDPNYKKAFDNHLNKQDLAKHAERARSERRRKDTKATVGKNARAVNRAINGPFAGPVVASALLGAVGFVKAKGLDQQAIKVGRDFINRQRYGTRIDLSFLNNK